MTTDIVRSTDDLRTLDWLYYCAGMLLASGLAAAGLAYAHWIAVPLL